MHALHAQPLLHRQELHRAAVQLFLLPRGLLRPAQLLLCHEIRQPDDRDPPERRLVRSAGLPLLPEALQRRHHIVEEAVDFMTGPPAHFQRVRHGIQHLYRLPVRTLRLIRVTLSPHRHVVHGGHRHDLRPILRQIKLPILLLKIKRHTALLSTFSAGLQAGIPPAHRKLCRCGSPSCRQGASSPSAPAHTR